MRCSQPHGRLPGLRPHHDHAGPHQAAHSLPLRLRLPLPRRRAITIARVTSATHAWVEALMPQLGWVGFDPTNWLVAGDRHIRTAIGRDYADVPPTHGIFRGRARASSPSPCASRPARARRRSTRSFPCPKTGRSSSKRRRPCPTSRHPLRACSRWRSSSNNRARLHIQDLPEKAKPMKRTLTAVIATVFAANAFAQDAAQTGIQLADLDRKVQPCDDFYEFANGSWRAANPIPASMDRWSRRWQAGENNKDQLRIILDDISTKPGAPAGSAAQLTGDFYAACVNQKAIDDAGITPLKPYLARIDGIATAADLQAVIRDMQIGGIRVPFSFNSSQNPHDPGNVIADTGAAGLGLPDRDYYLKPEKRFADARAGYLAYVAKMFQLAGATEASAKASAATVMVFETALAKASLDNVALRDPHATDHPADFAALQKATPHFDWAAYYQSDALAPGGRRQHRPATLPCRDRAPVRLHATCRLEDLPALAPAERERRRPAFAVCRGTVRLLPEAACRRRRTQASPHPVRGADGQSPRRGSRPGVCQTLLSAGSQAARARYGDEHPFCDARDDYRP